MDEFDISESGTHVALVEYSTEASVQLKFNDFSGAFLNAANVKRRIDRIPHNRGLTYIDKALSLANREVFTAEGGMRQNVTKVNIFCLFYFFDKISILRDKCAFKSHSQSHKSNSTLQEEYNYHSSVITSTV